MPREKQTAATDDTQTSERVISVGERLRAAREEKGYSLEDVAAQTRIPRRHLESIESANWSELPAPTYTIGFAKSYASAVGLDRNTVAEDVRNEIGGTRPANSTQEMFEPVDPARTVPRWLIFTALAAIVLVVIAMTWLNRRALDEPQPALVETEDPDATSAPAAAPQAPPAASGPVVLTATEPVWLQVSERDGRTLFQGELAAGQHYQVPVTASEPLLRTGKPEALRITIGNQVAPPVGAPATTVSNVSLRAEDLLNRQGSGVTVPAPSAPPGIQNTLG